MANNKRFLYVGGLADEVDVGLIKATFSAFGDLVDVKMPIDYTANKHRGFAFIEFQWPEDAADAIDNMDNGEILGKTIRVNLARPQRLQDIPSSEAQAEPKESEDTEFVMEDVTETNDPRDQSEPN